MNTMNISQHGIVTAVRICPQCEAMSYHTQDYPRLGLREFQCAAHQHLSFERLTSDIPRDRQQEAA
jgi:hypothetical protein